MSRPAAIVAMYSWKAHGENGDGTHGGRI